MTRTTSPRKTKRRTLLNSTKGYKKPANNHFKIAHQRFLKAQVHAFRDRHNKKRVFRHLWIGRLNAFLRNSFGISVRAQFNERNIIYEFFKPECLSINFYQRVWVIKLFVNNFIYNQYRSLSVFPKHLNFLPPHLIG